MTSCTLHSPLRLQRLSPTFLHVSTASRRCTNARRQQPVQATLKSLYLGAVGGVVISTAAVVMLHRQQQQQQQAQAGSAAQQRQRTAGGDERGLQLDGLLAAAARPGFGLGWPLHNKDQQLLKTLHDIERRQHKEAVRELRCWDNRFSLRLKPLAELRALAQKHNIAGRSKMRKPELIAALEAELGYVAQQRRHTDAAP